MAMPIDKFKSTVVDPAMVLLLNRNSLEFFGIMAYGMKIHIHDDDKAPSIGYTNGSDIYMSALHPYTPKSYAAVLIHELWHVINNHVQRRFDRHPVYWNLAVDTCTNHVIQAYVDKGLLEWPKLEGQETVFYMKELHTENPAILPEEVYDILIKDKDIYEILSIDWEDDPNQKPQQGQGQSQQQEGNNESTGEGESDSSGDNDQNGESQQNSQPQQGSQGKGGKVQVATVKNVKTGEIFKTIISPDSKDSQKTNDKMSQKAHVIWKSSTISKGDMPGDVVQILNEIFQIKIPWDEILEKSLLYHSQTPQRISWSTRNIYIPNKILPGKYAGEGVDTAVFVVDSSGSVDDESLTKFLSICCDSTQYFKQVIVIVHDHCIQQIHYFTERPNRQDVFNEIKKVKGRGGTSHKEPFAKLDELHEQENLSVVTFLTDYESDVEGIYKNHLWIQEVPTVWVLNTKHPVTIDVFDNKVINI